MGEYASVRAIRRVNGNGRARVRRGWSRRRLLQAMAAGGLGAALSACGGDDLDPFAPRRTTGDDAAAETQTQVQARAATPDQTQTEAPADTEPQLTQAAQTQDAEAAQIIAEPRVYLIPSPVPQGHHVLVLIDAPGAGAAAMHWRGETYSLLQEGDRFFGFFGVDANDEPGPQVLGIGVWAQDGRQLLWQETALPIESSDWTVDDIQIDGPNAALLDARVRRADLAARQPHQTGLTPRRHWLGVFDPPSAGPITALYGEQRSFNGGPISEYHTGIDFGGASGDAVNAPNSGIVVWTGETQRRGNGLIVDHGAGVFSGYYHLSEVLAATDNVVERGDMIARMGATGLATGPHLHWEVVIRGVTVNPIPWIRLLEVPDPLQELDPANAITARNLVAG